MRHMRLVTVCVAIVCTIVTYSSSVEPFPYIVPDGYNASLNGDAVFFKCMGPNNTEIFFWNVNGMSAAITGEGALRNQGIVPSTDVIMENNETYAVTSIETRAENNNTILQCKCVHSDSVKTSSDVIFRVQGLLEAPTALETEQLTSTHNVLRWTNPYTLDLTDILHDISGYTVTVTMEHPPPQYPYDLSLTLEQLNQTVNQTYHISHSGQASFPRYAFPVWLSVSAENPVGQGATSLPLKYTPPTPEGCLRLYDMVSGEFGSEVTLTDTASVSVEIQLFQQPFLNGVDYCFDTVVVVVSVSETVTGSGGGASGESGDDGETHVLVPILSETGVSVVLESDLEEDTHYTATLSFNSHLISTITFSTYAVRDVSIVEVSNGLTVKCIFAEGSSQNTCTVVLVLDGVKQGRESSSGEMTFPDLATGLYTVLVYDSEPGMEGNGRSPALEREVEVTGVTTVPTSTPPSVPASPTSDPATEEPSIEGVTDGGGEHARPNNRSDIKGHTLWIVIGSIAIICTVIISLIVLVLIVKCWYKSKSKVAVPLATDVLYDEISLPPLTSTAAVIPTEPNSAYATTLSLKGPTPPIITEDNVAYSYM